MGDQVQQGVRGLYGSLHGCLSPPFKDDSLTLSQKLSEALLNCYAAASVALVETHGAYLYPLKGISRLLRLPKLHQLLIPSFLGCVMLAAAVTGALFLATWTPQFVLLSFLLTPIGALPVVTVLVLAEAVYVTYVLSKLTWLKSLTMRVFDAVVLEEAAAAVAAASVGHNADPAVDALQQLASAISARPPPSADRFARQLVKRVRRYPRRCLGDTLRHLATLPFNLIPGVGTAFYFAAESERTAQRYFARYFELREESVGRNVEVNSSPLYTTFGAVSMYLDHMPVINFFFALTNAAGAALLACEVERARHRLADDEFTAAR